MKLAVIPARGESKRIPRKNIRPFRGKPMIAWSIEAARNSNVFDRIMVSTDDPEIAEVARDWGADVPFMRPTSLSDDYAGTTAVMAHAVAFAGRQGVDFADPASAVCCIYATAPMLRPFDIAEGLQRLQSGAYAYVFSACEYASPIFRSFRLTERGVEMFFPEKFAVRSQDLPVALHDAGQFYWGLPSAWLEETVIFAPHSSALVIPPWRVQDIDNQDDWKRAELMHEALEAREEQ